MRDLSLGIFSERQSENHFYQATRKSCVEAFISLAQCSTVSSAIGLDDIA